MAEAYGIRFSFLYRAKMRGKMLYEVIIEERGFVGTPEILKPCDDVLTIRQGSQDDSPFVPIKGSEATIKILCCRDMQYLSLFTTDAHKYRVSIFEYRKNCQGNETPVLMWRGYIDANSYTEKFAKPPYVVTIKAIDGLAALNNYPLKDVDDKPLSGLISAKTLLDMCVSKLELDLPVSEWIGARFRAGDATTLDNIYYEASDIYQSNPQATFADALKLCLPYGSQIMQSSGYLHIRRVVSLINLSRPSSYTMSHDVIGLTRQPVISLWEGGCGISATAEFKVLPPVKTTIVKTTFDTKKDLVKWFGLYNRQAWRDFSNVACVFDNCVQIKNCGAVSKIIFDRHINAAKSGGIKIKFDIANLRKTNANITAALRLNSYDSPKTFAWIPDLDEWREDTIAIDTSMNIVKQILPSKHENLNIYKKSNSADFNSESLEFSPGSIPETGLLYIDFACGTMTSGSASTWIWDYLQIYNIAITMTGDGANSIISEKTDVVNNGYMGDLKIDVSACEGVFIPNTDLYFKTILRDANKNPRYFTLTTHSGMDTFESIFADARILREGASYTITGELQCHLPVDANTIFYDKKFTKKLYYITYLERIASRNLYKVQLSQLIDVNRHMLFTGGFKEVTGYDQFDVNNLFTSRTTLYFKSGNQLYRRNIDGSIIKVLSAVELYVWQSGDCVTVGYLAADGKQYLAAYNPAGSVVSKIENPKPSIGVGIGDKIFYDAASERWAAATIASDILTVTLFKSDYTILDTRTFSGKNITHVDFVSCGLCVTGVVDGNKKSWSHNYSLNADGELDECFINNITGNYVVVATNGIFYMCKPSGSTALSLCFKGDIRNILGQLSTCVGNLNATVSSRYMAANTATTIYIYDGYDNTTSQVNVRTNTTIDSLAIIGNTLYVVERDMMNFTKILSYCIKDDSVLGDANTYTYLLTPSSFDPIVPAGGGSVVISATLNIYSNGSLVSSEIVQPVISGKADGFSISNNVVTAAYRGDIEGAKRNISLTLNYTFTLNGQTITTAANTTLAQQTNVKTYVSFANSNLNKEISAAGDSVKLYGLASYSFTSGKNKLVDVLIDGYENVKLHSGVALTPPCNLTATNRGVVDGIALSSEMDVWHIEGGVTHKYHLVVCQEANHIVSYDSPIIKSFNVNDLPAGGGVISSGIASFSQLALYTSGSRGDVDISMTQISYSSPISASSLGTIVKARTQIGVMSVTIVSNNKSANKSANVYQQANEIIGGTLLNIDSFTVVDIPAAGGTVSTGDVKFSQKISYTSGSTIDADPSAAKVTFGSAVTAPSLGTSLTSRTIVGSLDVTVTSNGRAAKSTAKVYQAANTRYDRGVTVTATPAYISSTGGTSTLTSQLLFVYESGVEIDSDVTSQTTFRAIVAEDGMTLLGNVVTATALGVNMAGRTLDIEAAVLIDGSTIYGYAYANQEGNASVAISLNGIIYNGSQNINLTQGIYDVKVGYLNQQMAKETTLRLASGNIKVNMGRAQFEIVEGSSGRVEATGICPGMPQITLGINIK